ncbi:alpha/beta hydrolase [Nocardioides sp. CER19]|uniref:alpha/beta hydrolase n=1 Tax=Nocardioides sp. CER19 TaxID=3038538 RepID=UPI00244CD805|nr:alpha/beta hydrolase [Nocardioides sp. CER19]MDH2414019.1 alpha/beta hydrolase [Nocardioides sp. CER19]
MTLFRQAAAAVANYQHEPKVWEVPVADQRAASRLQAAREPKEEVADVTDLDADGVPCRLYQPGDRTWPGGNGLVVHFHGGGFVFNDVEVHDAVCRRFANRAGLAVLSVDYRRPPEQRFPAAVEDVDTVVGWLQRQDRDPQHRTFVHGDSAGGNLALVAALRHPGVFDAVALVYPFLDPSQAFDSHDTAADGFDRAEAAWYWEQYAASPADYTNPDLAPLLSDRLHTLPPTLVVTAEHDPLRDEGEELARRLDAAGVEVTATRYLGQTHGFWRHDAFTSADRLLRQVSGFLASYA